MTFTTHLFLGFLLLLTPTNPIVAQPGKKTVTIAPFTFSKQAVSSAGAEVVSKEVQAILTTSRRFTMVDRDNSQLINAERELQKGEDFIDSKVIEQGASLGADLIFIGHVISYSSKEGPVIHLSIIDIATREITASEIITTQERRITALNRTVDAATRDLYYSSNKWRKTGKPKVTVVTTIIKEASAMNNTLEKQLLGFIDDHFPLRFPILQYDEIDERKGVQSVLLQANEKDGLKKGDKFKIVEAVSIESRTGASFTREKEIGKAQVKQIEGDVTVCKVTWGHEELVALRGKPNVYLIRIR